MSVPLLYALYGFNSLESLIVSLIIFLHRLYNKTQEISLEDGKELVKDGQQAITSLCVEVCNVISFNGQKMIRLLVNSGRFESFAAQTSPYQKNCCKSKNFFL